MVVGENFNDIYLALACGLYNDPSYSITNRKGEKVFEFINKPFVLLQPYKCFATCRELSLKYLECELDMYIKGTPFLEDAANCSKFWEKCSDDNRTINSNYGKLLLHDRNVHNYTQFEYAKDMLMQNKESKKAVMTIYNKENAFKSKDNPCTMYLQFFIRNNSLYLYVKMRSSDIWFGLPYDVPFFVYIHYRMLKELFPFYDLKIGTYNHQSGSLHLYERNISQIEKILDQEFTEEDNTQSDLFSKIINRRI